MLIEIQPRRQLQKDDHNPPKSVCDFVALVGDVGRTVQGAGAQTEILHDDVNANGQVEPEVNSSPDHYYILQVRREPSGAFEISSSMTLGEVGTTIISEPLAAYPLEHYRVLEYPKETPADTDGDGIDDITEFESPLTHAPLNPAPPVDATDGTVTVNSMSIFNELSLTQDVVQWSEFLNEKKIREIPHHGLSHLEPKGVLHEYKTPRTARRFWQCGGRPTPWRGNKKGADYFPAVECVKWRHAGHICIQLQRRRAR